MSTRGFGGLRDVGSTGYSWSSSIAGTDVHGLGFGYNGVNPQYYSNRANGFQLRCLQEHPQGVLLGFSQPNLNRACQARKFVLGRGAARHSNRAASTPGRGRRCFAPRPAQPKARPGFPYDGRRHPPGGETQRSLRSLALPLASAEKLLRRSSTSHNDLCPRAVFRGPPPAERATSPIE